jgi:hypothetical protein
VNGEAKAPKFNVRSEDDDWGTHLYNQDRMIVQQDEILGMQRRLVEALEKVASPERTRKVEEGQLSMVEAVNTLSVEMRAANGQLETAVSKLASTFLGVLKVPVAVVVVGAASWAYLYAGKISEHTWLLMLGVAVFPWLGDSISAVGKIVRGGNHK